MKPPVLLPLLLAPALGWALPATTTLTLVDDPTGTQNSLDVTLRIVVVFPFSDTDTTALSGTTEVRFDIDPATDQVSEMTILGADLDAEPVTLSVLGNNLASGPLGGTISTTTVPGVVEPSNGTYDAAQHLLLINEGNLTGTAFGSPVDVDFAVSPVGGVGSGSGTVSLVRTGTTATTAEYDIEFVLPIDTSNTTQVNGTNVTVFTVGSVKAAGTVSVPLNDYVAWTLENGIPGARFSGDENRDGISNGLLWGLGLTAADNPSPNLPAAALAGSVPEATVTLPAGGSAAPLFVEVTTDPAGTWNLAAGSALSTGVNPIPAGTSGAVTAALPGETTGYARIRVVEP